MSVRNNNRLSGTFTQNYEIQAEQLKYSVKKEVEEGNLIQEALKSLQRSFKYEEEKRSLAEQQAAELKEQIEELERTARELKEKIRLSRRSRKGKLDNEPDSDSDSEEKYPEDDDEHDEASHIDEFEFDDFLSELRDEDDVESTQMSVQQRLKLLRGLDTGGLDGKPTKKKSPAHYKEHHKKIMKQWIRRENTRRPMFDEVPRFSLKNIHIQARQRMLEEFIRTEAKSLASVDIIVNKHMTAFLKARILTPEHLKVVFVNIASFKDIHMQFIETSKSIQQLQTDFCALGALLSVNAEKFLQFLSGREESNELVKSASSRKRFQQFMESADISMNDLIKLQNDVVTHISSYPSLFINLLDHVNAEEYEAIGQGLSDIIYVLEFTHTPFQMPTIPHRLQMLFVQLSFDWLNKEATFINPNRKLLAQASVTIRKNDKSTEEGRYILFSDSVVISRTYMQKQIFRCFIPIEQVMIWDVPPRSNNKEYILELIDMENSKKIIVVCDNESDQDRLINQTISATLCFSGE